MIIDAVDCQKRRLRIDTCRLDQRCDNKYCSTCEIANIPGITCDTNHDGCTKEGANCYNGWDETNNGKIFTHKVLENGTPTIYNIVALSETKNTNPTA